MPVGSGMSNSKSLFMNVFIELLFPESMFRKFLQ